MGVERRREPRHRHPDLGSRSTSSGRPLGISQEELADRAQVHLTFIGAAERAETNISIDNIAPISAALGVRAAELMIEE